MAAKEISIVLNAKDQTKAAFASLQRQVDGTARSFNSLKNVMAGALAGVSISSTITKFIQETINAEQEQAQLAAVLRSTGEAAGWSQQQLNDMAESLARSSTFSAGEITNAQTRLMAYTGIVGKAVPETMQAIVDMSARTGQSIEQSAEMLGKAINLPSAGMTSLKKMGFDFGEEQIRAAKKLEAAGKVYEAQQIVLAELTSSYGGAAQAARDTFGGAVKALQNNINDLLTGDGGSMAQLKASVEGLNQTLESDETRAAFQMMVKWMTDVSTTAIQAAGGIVGLINRVQELRREAGPNGLINRVFDAAGAVVNPIGTAYGLVSGLIKGESPQTQEYQATVRALDNRIAGRAASGAAAASGTTDKKGGSKRDPEAEAKRAIESLQKQLEKTQELSEVEQVLLNIQRMRAAGGRVSDEQKQTMLGLAAQIDASKSLAEAEKARTEEEQRRSDAVKAQREEGIALMEQMRTPLERYNAELERLKDLADAGAISTETHARAVKHAGEAYEGATKQMDTFGQRFAENTQSQLGDGIYQALSGKFEDIGDAWADMLKRMMAEALATDLTRALFGDLVQGGSGSGLLGGLLGGGGSGKGGGGGGAGSLIGGAFSWLMSVIPGLDTGTDFVPKDMLALIHKGEKIVPASQNNGAGSTIVINQTVGDVATASMLEKNNARLKREISGALRRSQGYGGSMA